MTPESVIRRLYRMFRHPDERDYGRFLIAERISSLIYPKLTCTEYGRGWLDDPSFLAFYRERVGESLRSADRKYFLRSVLRLADDLSGDTAECGAYTGASSWLICDHFKQANKTHFVFDSFAGLSSPAPVDGAYWSRGDMAASAATVTETLADYRVQILEGWIPERFTLVDHRQFCFVHIDVDLYQPTLDSLAFFYPRMVKGGVILCDDYGFITCPGAKKAFDDYLTGKSEKIIDVPTGQAFIVKK